MFNFFKRKPARRAIKLPITAVKYDAAQTTADNERHWGLADCIGPNASASPSVRATLRNRSRYEFENNCYLSGIIETLADYQVGTGPLLQMLTENVAANQKVEELFARWCEEVDFAGKLWTMRVGLAVDGEAFAILTTNPNLGTPVKLDFRPIEPEMVSTPFDKLNDDKIYDGIEYDEYGNVVAYYVLDDHPNDIFAFSKHKQLTYKKYPASEIIHWYKARRAGQKRGVPETTPSLPLFANLRRYTEAVLAAAETAAELAMVLFTDAPAGGEAADVDAMDVISLEKRMATVLPEGWKLGQMQAEQPSTGYGEFKKEIINEVARGFTMPYNVAAGNSAGYNYASGRLDHQTFFRRNRVAQAKMKRDVLDRIFDAWMSEAVLIEDYLPESMRRLVEYKHSWFFDSEGHVDPAKEANAQNIRLRNHTTTYAEEYARRGKDWLTEFEQIAREKAKMRSLGIDDLDIAGLQRTRKER
ncbi:MAG TPA: phage portal protein [Anaerohalosphaeraceae bacterium]|nr:phage portal protein [Anaerohalosphaeraceae bacterium]